MEAESFPGSSSVPTNQAVVTTLAVCTAAGKASLLPRLYLARRSTCFAIPRFSTGLQDPWCASRTASSTHGTNEVQCHL